MTMNSSAIRRVISMSRTIVFLAVSVLFLVGVLTPALAVKKYAVLVGCNEYDGVIAPPLTGCITDVKNISEALKKHGYKVWMMTDDAIDPDTKKPNPARYYPLKQNIERQLPIWIPAGGFDKGDTVIFFFSGHGVRMTDGNDYLVPLGFQSVEPSDLVGLSRVYEILRKSGAENIVVITDACRNIPGKSVGGMDDSKGFGEKSLEKAKSLGSGDQRYAFLRSCAEDQKSYERADGSGGNYAYYLVKGLEGNADGAGDSGKTDGIVTIGELNAYAKENVMTEAQKKNQVQIPQYERKGDDPDSISMAVDSKFVAKPVAPEDGKVEAISTSAIIKVTSNPAGAAIWVDDVQIDGQITPCEVEIDLGAAKSKKVEVALKLAGCKDAVYNITALRGKSVALVGKLAAKPKVTPVVDTPDEIDLPVIDKTPIPANTETASIPANAKQYKAFILSEPKRAITRYEWILAYAKTFGLEDDDTSAVNFIDVPSDSFAIKAIAGLSKRGMMSGYPGNMFMGKKTLTRYEFAVALDKQIDILAKETGIAPRNLSSTQQFIDVPDDHWAFSAIQKIGELFKGNLFYGKKSITRGEVNVVLERLVSALQ